MKLLLRLYPRSWRSRYQKEVEATLAEMHGGPRVAWDLLRGAVDAHLHPQPPCRRSSFVKSAAVALVAVACAGVLVPVLRDRWPLPAAAGGVVALVLVAGATWRRGRRRRRPGWPDDGDRSAGVPSTPSPGRPPALAAAIGDESRE